ncbi:MAG: ImmA/IrrE family metallo-endopeptidase [Clostridia bacterium]|nr:ImmA/IrrE family metallo-endopeptidase [Clostridia bacterium]
MKKAKKAVGKFKRIYKVKGTPTSYELKRIIKKFGFITYGYSENEDKLHETKTYNLSKEKYAFTYIRGNQKFVFYDDLLNEVDAERALAHEVAHLYYNHFYRKTTIFDSDVNKEWESNLFAACLLEPINYKSCIVRSIISVTLALLIFFYGMYFPKKASEQTKMPQIDYVYITPTGHHYHRESCQYGREYINSFVVDRQTAKEHYLPCDLCNPEK